METSQNTQNSPRTLRMAPEGILALRTEYLRENDPTEYSFAKRYIGSWSEWEQMQEDEELKPIIGGLRSELAVKLRSEALSRIIEAAKGETRDALGANKYLYEVLDKDKKNNVGRPSKDAISKEAYKLFEEQQLKEEVYKRIFNTDEHIQ